MSQTDILLEYLPFILPLILLQVGLAFVSVVHILRHPHFKFGTKPMWLLIVIFINFIGPMIYFVFGKGDE